MFFRLSFELLQHFLWSRQTLLFKRMPINFGQLHFSQPALLRSLICGGAASYFLRSIAFRQKFVAEVILEKSGLERMSLGDASVYGACLTEFFASSPNLRGRIFVSKGPCFQVFWGQRLLLMCLV
jgi:hypothetical protein